MLGKIEGRRRGQQRMRWLDGITDLSKLQGLVTDFIWGAVSTLKIFKANQIIPKCSKV